MKRTICIIAIVVAALSAFAQIRETVNVNLVEVPVIVFDGSGNPVRGLTADNFELTDNGTKVRVSTFDKIDFTSTESMKAISPLNPAARRQFMLLFDMSNSSPNALARAQEAARQFVKDTVQPRDLVAVGTIEAERGFRLLTAFTTDRELIASAMNDPAAFRGNDPLQIANQTVTFKPQEELPGSGGGKKSEAAEHQREIAQLTTKGNEGFNRQRIERSVDALGQLAYLLRALPGRKQIILLTEGFDAKYLEGRDAKSTQEQMLENEKILRGEVYSVDNDARFGNTASQTILDRMAVYFRQSDVVLHAIDIQGVRLQNDIQEGRKINSNSGLFLLSRPTGGEVFQNANDVKQNFQRILHQQEVVYVLGFQAPSQKPGAYHNLKVKLVNVPNGRVSYRTGYYEGGTQSAAERALSNAEVIVNDVPQPDVRLNALSAAFPTGGKNAQVPVILEINGADLVKNVRGNSANVEIYIYAFDDEGIVRDRMYQKLTLDMKKVGDKLRDTGIKYYGTLSLPPGTYAVKSLVRSIDADRRGYSRVDIIVPRANEVAALQPVPIDEQPKWLLVKGNSHDASGAYPFVLNGQQFIPSAAARMNGTPQKVAVFVYGANPDELTWETTPKTKFLGRAQGANGVALVLELAPADANVASLDITVRRKGVLEAKKLSLPIVQ